METASPGQAGLEDGWLLIRIWLKIVENQALASQASKMVGVYKKSNSRSMKTELWPARPPKLLVFNANLISY